MIWVDFFFTFIPFPKHRSIYYNKAYSKKAFISPHPVKAQLCKTNASHYSDSVTQTLTHI